MRVALGVLSKLYVRTGGTYNSPVWTEVDLVADLVVGGQWQEGESTVRRSRIQTMEATILPLELTGSVRKDTSDTGYRTIDAAWRNAVALDFLVMDGQIQPSLAEGASGYRFNAQVFNWGEDQGLGVVIFKQFSAKPCAFPGPGEVTDESPKYAEVISGDLIYSELAAT